MILRTDPSNGADDVPLNTRIIVVFSEPIDPATATRARVQLRRRGLPVAADISFSESALEMEVRPEGGLAPLSSYALVVSAELADPGGDRLKEGVQVEFTTGTTFHWDIAPGNTTCPRRLTSSIRAGVTTLPTTDTPRFFTSNQVLQRSGICG
jgi:hypothetical protein